MSVVSSAFWKSACVPTLLALSAFRCIARSARSLARHQRFPEVNGAPCLEQTFYGSKMLIECECKPPAHRSSSLSLLAETRPLFIAYIDEVQRALRFVRESKDATLEEKKKFFKSANKVRHFVPELCLCCFVLCTHPTPRTTRTLAHQLSASPAGLLSATVSPPPLFVLIVVTSSCRMPFLYPTDHFGVVSAFLKSGTIPRVVTGTSAGALVAA